MAKLSKADQALSADKQKTILEAKGEWETAYKNNDKKGMEDAHKKAEDARGTYSGGASGNEYHPTGGAASGVSGGGDKKPTLSKTDQYFLNADQQAQILNIKGKYQTEYDKGAAADADILADLNRQANDIRALAGYSGGDSGNEYIVLPYGAGGKSYEQLAAEDAAFVDRWYKPEGDWRWINGYDVSMNTRSRANRIRQQMLANENAMVGADETRRSELHAQNMLLAGLLPGGTTTYNEKLGRWETTNPNVGYGYDITLNQANIRNDLKKFYGYTDEQLDQLAGDTSHYYNFVDARASARNTTDESSGFTGQYAQFVNGPYASLISPGATPAEGPWNDTGEGNLFTRLPQYDENGNVIKIAPTLNNNNDASAYTRQFLPVTVNGLLTGHGAKINALDPTTGDNNIEGQRNYYINVGSKTPRFTGAAASGGSASSFEGYLQQIYASALEAQLKALESGYNANLSDLDASQKSIDSAYTEQKRQTSGESARQSAAWREVANAYGLNSGAVGQANLAQRNQLQSDLNRLNAAQAAARTELQRQRILLGQQYQSAIEQAVAENNSQLAMNLYQEAVRAEEALQQQNQFYANLALQYGKSMASFAKDTGSLSLEEQFSVIESAVKNGFISEAQAMTWAQQMGLV